MSHSTLKSYMNDEAGQQPAASVTEPAPATESAFATEPAPAPEPASEVERASEAEPLSRHMLGLLFGKLVSRAIGLAAELGVADHLQAGPLGHEQLAGATGTNPAALYRVLRALVAVGVFEEQPGRRFANNALSATLLSGAPGSVRNTARLLVTDFNWAASGGLGHGVRSGQPGFDSVFGTDLSSWLATHPESRQLYQGAMGELSEVTGRAVVEAYDFSSLETIVDVGGGPGRLLSLILERHPALRGVLFDRPEVIAGARKALDGRAQSARITAVGGDFFVSVPSGADAYILQLITRDWADEPCAELLRNCRRSMAAGGRVLIVDAVVGDGQYSALQALMDLEMLALTSGRERTLAEFSGLLGRAGLRLTRVVPTSACVSIVEAVAG